jgi:DNA-binding PadR family transcriptional regulator
MVKEQQDRVDGQLLKGLLDTLVLAVLAHGDNYGFGILQKVSEQLGGDDTLLRDATLYPLLHRLEAKDFVESYFQPGQRGTPRKYYRITGSGKAQLKDRIVEWKRVAAILDQTVFKK